MARTRSSYIPLGVLTRGLGTLEYARGVNRATRGLVTDYPLGIPPVVVPEVLDPPPLLGPDAFDSSGIQTLLSGDILSLNFAHVSQELFANPDREYSGYAANGSWYTDGILDPTHVPFKAPWASEGEAAASLNRGNLDRFPDRLLAAVTPLEVALFDADTLTVWMRFLIPTSTVGTGNLAGVPATSVLHAHFVSGLLFLGCTDGLRVADFRNNEAHWLRNTTTGTLIQTTLGIEVRNQDDFYSGATLTMDADLTLGGDDYVYGMAAKTLSIPSALLKNEKTVVAVGHGAGLVGITYEALTSRMRCVHSQAALSVANVWDVADDTDGDNFTPYFTDTIGAATNWLGQNVRPGDVLLTTPQNVAHIISVVDQSIPGDQLVLAPEMDLTLEGSGTSYIISRAITSLLISPSGHLYIGGSNQVVLARSTDWFTVGDVWGAGGTGFVTGFDKVNLAANVDRINSMDLRGTELYVATTLGIFRASDEDFTESRSARFVYSTEAVTEAEADFKILEGTDKDCRAVSVDPETGYVMVAVTDVNSVVTEINPDIEQAFRFFDNVGRVKALVSFRNPLGPPDREVT